MLVYTSCFCPCKDVCFLHVTIEREFYPTFLFNESSQTGPQTELEGYIIWNSLIQRCAL